MLNCWVDNVERTHACAFIIPPTVIHVELREQRVFTWDMMNSNVEYCSVPYSNEWRPLSLHWQHVVTAGGTCGIPAWPYRTYETAAMTPYWTDWLRAVERIISSVLQAFHSRFLPKNTPKKSKNKTIQFTCVLFFMAHLIKKRKKNPLYHSVTSTKPTDYKIVIKIEVGILCYFIRQVLFGVRVISTLFRRRGKCAV